ncbi:hypothetical protein [Caballeronia choica]|uniref:hypothetical protein n=1 Tax=Caballeronia choica TaxID=326476 RepID=UPI000F73B8AB|nr:hypothetical protein [Caballeronia choica]
MNNMTHPHRLSSKIHLDRNAHLEHDNRRLREALRMISDIAESGTTTSLPNIARLARNALLAGPPANPALLDSTRAKQQQG